MWGCPSSTGAPGFSPCHGSRCREWAGISGAPPSGPPSTTGSPGRRPLGAGARAVCAPPLDPRVGGPDVLLTYPCSIVPVLKAPTVLVPGVKEVARTHSDSERSRSGPKHSGTTSENLARHAHKTERASAFKSAQCYVCVLPFNTTQCSAEFLLL